MENVREKRKGTDMTSRRFWTAGFYWAGIALTLACFGLVLSGNTDLIWRFEHRPLPLSWAVAGAGVLAFLAAECTSVLFPRRRAEERSSQLASQLEAVES